MTDINSPDFIEGFDPSKATVGVIGHGYVGSAVENFFSPVIKTLVHDKAKESSSLEDLVRAAEVLFVCVPTPMNKDGSCHTGIVEEVLDSIVKTAAKIDKNLGTMVVVVKSTVYPGFTDSQKEKHPGLRLVFSPEFLTEANSIQDFVNTNRVLFGGDLEDGRILFKYFEARFPEKVKNDLITICSCDAKVAEMVKLFTNGILMTKVLFCNEIFEICQSLNLSYEEVRVLALLDRRIGASHTLVPGPDGHLGAGGSCFPKDINNLKHIAAKLGTKEKIFSAVIERNSEVRPEKDWEDLKGRAVVE